jgi:CubicO group peptidase (beta-lactamase class C family)
MKRSLLSDKLGPLAQERKIPVAACCWENGKIADVFARGLQDGDPLDTTFPIASLSKSFTAAAILALRDEGKLALSDSVGSFLPELHDRERWKIATVLHVLSMQSGLATDNPWADRFLAHDDPAMDTVLAQPFIFAAPPGKEYHYSNLGYMLLGRIISRVSEEHALSFISKRILAPLGMSASSWNGVCSDTAVFGGLSSTLRDICRWIAFLIDTDSDGPGRFDEVLRRDSRRELQRGVVLIPGDYFTAQPVTRAAYAFGTARYPLGTGWAVGHSGGLPGSGCHMRWSIEHRCAVAAWGLATYFPAAGPCGEILEELAHDTRIYPTPTALVLERGETLRSLISNWDDAIARDLFSSNFFQDVTTEQAKAKLSAVCSAVNGNVRRLEIIGDRGVGGFLSHGGSLLLAFTLAPAEGGRIQELR